MDKWETIAERRIREAIEEGIFDHLEGSGKPIKLEENAFENPEARMAHWLLRNHGFALPWIEELKDLAGEREKLQAALARSWQRLHKASGVARPNRSPDVTCSQLLSEFSEQVRELNRRITAFNLKAPSTRFHLAHFNAAHEIRRVVRQ